MFRRSTTSPDIPSRVTPWLASSPLFVSLKPAIRGESVTL
jgi:hypothetical protein